MLWPNSWDAMISQSHDRNIHYWAAIHAFKYFVTFRVLTSFSNFVTLLARRFSCCWIEISVAPYICIKIGENISSHPRFPRISSKNELQVDQTKHQKPRAVKLLKTLWTLVMNSTQDWILKSQLHKVISYSKFGCNVAFLDAKKSISALKIFRSRSISKVFYCTKSFVLKF